MSYQLTALMVSFFQVVLAAPPTVEGFDDFVFFLLGLGGVAVLLAVALGALIAILDIMGFDPLGLVSVIKGRRG